MGTLEALARDIAGMLDTIIVQRMTQHYGFAVFLFGPVTRPR
jgi:hypothetical protein